MCRLDDSCFMYMQLAACLCHAILVQALVRKYETYHGLQRVQRCDPSPTRGFITLSVRVNRCVLLSSSSGGLEIEEIVISLRWSGMTTKAKEDG
ncbi:hypothetical protein B0I35DRAFT_144486 [Stachybotrys elegans]|uniref:Uncharacterized protein n=1 Tax=Stachybotrys elegans TaxID=80388 RepID=A0A8K0WVL0_9HYPO|nr:hypothetical protein B0I35DRAFT_144486 [Stachybotrys elegans]